MTTFLDLHILQQVPPSNLNRDDTGSPKTAVYGGVRRARVSSQAWKRATRTAFRDHLDASELGYRTTRLVELIARRIESDDEGTHTPRAEALAQGVVTALGLKVKGARPTRAEKTAGLDSASAPRSEYLVFLSSRQIERLAEVAISAEGGSLDKRAAKEAAQRDHSIDVALFGRMVADDATLNVDAAVQVAHALSTHAVDNEFDYYTAVDDENPREETGAGMIGTVEFNSATLYRYATVNVDGLTRNLGSAQAAARATEAFVQAFVTSMPTGKQNTFGNRTLPEAVVLMVRTDQPVNLAGAFEEPVRRTEGGFTTGSASALAAYAAGVHEAYGNAPSRTLVVSTPACRGALESLGEGTSLAELVAAAGASVVEAAPVS